MSGEPKQDSGGRQFFWVVVVAAVLLLFWYLPPIAARQDAVFRSFAPLVAIKAHIQKRYVEPVDDEQLIDGAIRGMVERLDPHCAYLSARQYPEFLERAKGGYVGIGIQVEIDPQTRALIITGPTEDSPAFESGVRIGDIIVEIAGAEVDRLDPFEATERLRGLEGSIAHFTVERPPDFQRVAFAVPRKKLVTRSIMGFQRLPDGNWDYLLDRERRIGYVRIREFWDNTASGFDAALDALQDGGLNGLVLDLRFNPGGDMQVCLRIADRFIANGVLLTTRNRRQIETTVEASADHVLPPFPVAVLINRASASGAEILAGVLQEYHRGRLFGERTFGKGSVQSIIPLEDELSGLRLTTAYYYLPSGRCIHRRPGMTDDQPWGIEPDEPIELSLDDTLRVHEQLARSHLPQAEGQPRRQAQDDPQLAAAAEWITQRMSPP